MTHKNTLPDEMKIAYCNICTLATGLRDYQSCPFNIGLLYKTLAQVKQTQQPINLELQRAKFVQHVQQMNGV